MKRPYDINKLPFKTLIYAKEELNEILNNRTDFNEYETINTIKYLFSLIDFSSLTSESETDEKYCKLLNTYFGVNTSEENNYKCMKDMLDYINEKIKTHNIFERIKL
jgi:hypothetical protein